MNCKLTAKEAVDVFGELLIGKDIVTPPMGNYPGGLARIISLHPDPAAPEIIMWVKHPTFGEIGIFEDELVNPLT